jgi:hypothetical protein
MEAEAMYVAAVGASARGPAAKEVATGAAATVTAAKK